MTQLAIQNGESKVKVLFDGAKAFSIPSYQRAYAWEVDPQIETFLKDLRSQPQDKPYYLGTLLLESRGERDGFACFDIVDGQQRLTTLIILMSVLIRRIGPEDKTGQIARSIFLEIHGERKFHAANDDDLFFWTYVVEDNDLHKKEFETQSQRKLFEARLSLNPLCAMKTSNR